MIFGCLYLNLIQKTNTEINLEIDEENEDEETKKHLDTEKENDELEMTPLKQKYNKWNGPAAIKQVLTYFYNLVREIK